MGAAQAIPQEVVRRAKPYSPEAGKCMLCIQEKLEIAKALEDPQNVNKKSELMGHCLHKVSTGKCGHERLQGGDWVRRISGRTCCRKWLRKENSLYIVGKYLF